jgi:HPt (histidine-containing phosphotransfer) domain-containing protein
LGDGLSLENNWRERVDPDFQDLVPEFVKNLQSESARLPGLLKDADFGELARIGHNFKGAAGYFGLTELEQLARALELHSKAGDKLSVTTTIERWQALLLQIEPSAQR